MKNKTLPQIADELEEDVIEIEPIYKLIKDNPDKTKEEILSVLCVSDGSYRTMRSRARKRLGIIDKELEAFLLEIN